nr:hypothetical protein [Anaerolineae bacterium]
MPLPTIEYSQNLKGRNLKVLHWGSTATGKTESVLRYYPDVLLIDCEGNSDQCVGMSEVPEFLRVVTKDVYEILDVMDAVSEGKIKFPDGRPVQTLGIDGYSILWSVRQEAGSLNAERRANRRGNNNPDEVSMTQLDWVLAKRPLKRLNARLNAPGVKYLVLTTREKDQYVERQNNGRTELVKEGVTIDAMRGLDYEVNFALHMQSVNPFRCQVTKAQGSLGKMFPVGTVLDHYPAEELLAYATGGGTATSDDVEVAERQLLREASEDRSQGGLLALGSQRGMSAQMVADALKANGITGFEPQRWTEMVEAIMAYDNGNGSK